MAPSASLQHRTGMGTCCKTLSEVTSSTAPGAALQCTPVLWNDTIRHNRVALAKERVHDGDAPHPQEKESALLSHPAK